MSPQICDVKGVQMHNFSVDYTFRKGTKLIPNNYTHSLHVIDTLILIRRSLLLFRTNTYKTGNPVTNELVWMKRGA